MKHSTQLNPTEICVTRLKEHRAENIKNDISPSENQVIDRLLLHSKSLQELYSEICAKLMGNQIACLLGILLDISIYWRPEANKTARDDRQKLIELNQDIVKKSNELAQLLRKRSEICNLSGFSCNTYYDICDVIEDAAKDNDLFKSYIRKRFTSVRAGFDLKYWPDLPSVVSQIGSDAECAEVVASDPLTAAATESLRASVTDYFKALFAAFNENEKRFGGLLPNGFKLTDGSLAAMANIFLDLQPESIIDSGYVKGVRQRLRKTMNASLTQ